MRPESVPPITPEEMFRIWPDIWRAEDVATIEIESAATKYLDQDLAGLAVASAVDSPEYTYAPDTTRGQSRPVLGKARHALRHAEFGPFKIYRVALPLAAVAMGVTVAYFSPHGTPPASAERSQSSASPKPDNSESGPQTKKPHPSASPTNIPFAISGYEATTAQSYPWRFNQDTVSPSVPAAIGTPTSRAPQPGSSHAPSQTAPTKNTPSAPGTPTQQPEQPNEPSTAEPTPTAPQPSETTPASEPSGSISEEASPPQTPQSETSLLQTSEAPSGSQSSDSAQPSAS